MNPCHEANIPSNKRLETRRAFLLETKEGKQAWDVFEKSLEERKDEIGVAVPRISECDAYRKGSR